MGNGDDSVKQAIEAIKKDNLTALMKVKKEHLSITIKSEIEIN